MRSLKEAPHTEGKMIPDENKDLAPFLNLVVMGILDQIILLNHCGPASPATTHWEPGACPSKY